MPGRDATGRVYGKAILRVEPDGRLVLRKEDGEEKTYLFKEVEYVIPTPSLPKEGGLVSRV